MPQWNQEAIPSVDGNVIGPPGIDIKDIAVAVDGITIWVGPGSTIPLTVFKSTNVGTTWTAIPTNVDGLAGINADLVAIAPDNSNFIVICDTNTLTIYISTNGGITWNTLGIPDDTGANPATIINDIDISAAGPQNVLAVAGVDTNGLANIWYYKLGNGGSWIETNNLNGWSGTEVIALAVKFSPNFASDKLLTAVATDGVDTWFEIFSLDSWTWNNVALPSSGYPVKMLNGASSISSVEASIALSPTYLGSDDVERVAFVGVTADTKANSGVYRLLNANNVAIKTNTNIYSIAFDGNVLVASTTDVRVWRSNDPLASSPTFYVSAETKSPGGASSPVLRYAGANVVCGTAGSESAFSVSADDGASFNDISLIDTALTILEDVAVSADGSIIYLVTNDTANTSVWRYDGTWQRVLSVTATANYIIRIAPDNPDVVYIAQTSAKTIYYSKDGGVKRWYSRTSRYDIQDIAVESADVAYVAQYASPSVSKTTNSGFTWGTAKNSELMSGNIHSITSVAEDQLLVGGASGYVSYSTDGNRTWNPIHQIIAALATNVQVTANCLASGNYIFASDATTPGVGRWEIGQAATTPWHYIDIVGVPRTGSGIALHNGILYESSSAGAVRRSLFPTQALPPTFDNISTGALTFATAPSALRLSATSFVKLWAIDTTTMMLYSFNDTLAPIEPTITVPVTKTKVRRRRLKPKALNRKFPYDVAISYASEDIAIPEKLANMLSGKGARVFFDRISEAELWGKDLYQHFIKVFKNSALYCVVFTSQNYANKVWAEHELKAAQARALEEVDKEYILPIKLDDTRIPSILPTIGYIDARKTSIERITNILIEKILSDGD